MVDGYASLNAGDLVQAQSHFLKAQALRPGATEVVEALAQVEDHRRAARIESVRQKALAANQREDWAGALAAYEEALGMQPTLQFAQQGKERAAALLALERRIAFFVKQPGVLDSDAQLESAKRLLQELQSTPPIGSRLRAEADKLESLVQAAQIPVRVLLESDGLTEVSVYRVGRLGRFITRELSLRAGIYTVVGSRDGHQDERLDFAVQPGSEPVRITVVCKVRL
jgi:tetratricopeptide (TPR) repeat protein